MRKAHRCHKTKLVYPLTQAFQHNQFDGIRQLKSNHSSVLDI